jgi:hypothetical protein
VPGAHDIFYAFAGGVGPGAGVVSVTLGPGCASVPPTGCIPALGETIFFTLDTLKGGSLLGSVQYSFIAPAPPPTNSLFTLPPCRVADTRNPVGPSGGPALLANNVRSFPVSGVCGIPPSATAVAINIAVVQPTDGGDLRIFPAGGAVPLASALNFRAGIVRANNAIVPLGAGGQITIQNDMPLGSNGTTNLFFDVYGYFQ